MASEKLEIKERDRKIGCHVADIVYNVSRCVRD
jgi:hypothetical protein